jgi:hypothetical protein
MKKLLLGLLTMTIANSTSANESYEIVSYRYKDGVSFEEQRRSTDSLNAIVAEFNGFKSRAFYYSEESQRWFDFVTWESLEHAKSASEQAMKNPEALRVFGLMNEESMIFSHFKKMGGVNKD